MTSLLTQDHFNEITKDFQRTILHDDGLYRNIRYNHPETSNMYWSVITYPGGCTIRGDYGRAYTFEREPDMLKEFFAGTGISFRYWQEKVISGRENCREYTEDAMREAIRDIVEYVAEDFHSCPEREDNPDLLENTKIVIVEDFMRLIDHSGEAAISDVTSGSISSYFDEFDECTCDEDNGWDGEISLSDLDADWWEGFDPTGFRYDFLYACYALQKTANDWLKDELAITKRAYTAPAHEPRVHYYTETMLDSTERIGTIWNAKSLQEAQAAYEEHEGVKPAAGVIKEITFCAGCEHKFLATLVETEAPIPYDWEELSPEKCPVSMAAKQLRGEKR